MKNNKKDLMIKALIDDDIDTIQSGEAPTYLHDLLLNGFLGYKKQTEKQLKEECLERFGEGRCDF